MLSHILKLDTNAYALTVCDDTDRVWFSYVFDTLNDAESAAEIAAGMLERQVPKMTYRELVQLLRQNISELLEQGY